MENKLEHGRTFMDRIISVLRVVAGPLVKKTVNPDFIQNMNFVSIECKAFSIIFNFIDCRSAPMHSVTFEAYHMFYFV